MDSITPEILLTETGKGSQRHFEALVARCGVLLYGVAMRVLKHEQDTKDLMQEVWMEVWNSARNYHGEKGAAQAWLTTLTHRRAIDRLKRLLRYREILEEHVEQWRATEPEETDPAADEIVQRNEAIQLAKWRVAGLERDLRLTPKQLEVFRACYVQGMSQGEAARHLGKTIPAIKELRDYCGAALERFLGRRIRPGH